MCDQVYSRGQLLGLWLQAEYSFTDVTRRQVWSARLGRERSRPRGRCEDNTNLQPLLIDQLIDNMTSSCRCLLDDLRRLLEMPFRCGLCVAPLLWQPLFPRVLDVRQATRHCRTWHTVMVSRQSYIVCRDLRAYLKTLKFITRYLGHVKNFSGNVMFFLRVMYMQQSTPFTGVQCKLCDIFFRFLKSSNLVSWLFEVKTATGYTCQQSTAVLVVVCLFVFKLAAHAWQTHRRTGNVHNAAYI